MDSGESGNNAGSFKVEEEDYDISFWKKAA